MLQRRFQKRNSWFQFIEEHVRYSVLRGFNKYRNRPLVICLQNADSKSVIDSEKMGSPLNGMALNS